MGNFTALQICWYLGIGMDVVLIVALCRRSLWRQWPSLLVYCSSDLLFDFAIQVNHASQLRYFYLYWLSSAVSALIQLWILSDVINSFPSAGFLRKELRWMILSAGVIMAIGSWFAAAGPAPRLAGHIAASVLWLNRCVSVAWAAFFISALLCIMLTNLAWSRRGAAVANGLLISTLANLVGSELLLHFSSLQNLGRYLVPLSSLVTLCAWCVGMLQPDEAYTLPDHIVAALKGYRTKLQTQ